MSLEKGPCKISFWGGQENGLQSFGVIVSQTLAMTASSSTHQLFVKGVYSNLKIVTCQQGRVPSKPISVRP